jgi:hypothetical protein
MKTRVIGEIIADRTVDWFEHFSRSKKVDCLCWAAIILAVLYFGPVCFRILARWPS